MKSLPFLFACVVLCAAMCQANRGLGAGQPYGAQVYQEPGVANPNQPSVFGQQAQGFGQDLGRRFANGFLNRAVFGVVNYAFRAIGF